MSRNKTTESDPSPRGFPETAPLGLKLTLILSAAALLMAVFLFGYFGPHTAATFRGRTTRLIDMSHDALSLMVRDITADSKDLLVNLIRHTTDARKRQMMDLPLSLYAGDMEEIRMKEIRDVVQETDAEMSRKLLGNVETLAGVMEKRLLDDVQIRMDNLTQEQKAMGTVFAKEIRRSYLLLAGAVFGALFVMLGLGLYRAVVHPLRLLRRGTRAVAAGNLDVTVPIRSRDEVGGLATDFGGMVRQLRESREDIRQKNRELLELNQNLEAEVSRKTSHLEKALQDLKQTQKQLIHAEKMASIGTLAGGVAHEFNNLIGGIRGCATEAMETETDSTQRENLAVILRAARRAGEITDQLLRFSRQRTTRMRLTDVTRIVREALDLIDPDAHKRGITVVRRITSCHPFRADGDALHQVFLNLCTNAVQAMPEGGELEVTTSVRASELVVNITDTGRGIPPEQIDRIFEPFFTTKDQDPDPAVRGVGLGLAVSYSIVEAHGGSLEAASESGEGTTFTVKLPIKSESGDGTTSEEEDRHE